MGSSSAERKFLGELYYFCLILPSTTGLKMCTPDYVCHEGHCCGRGRCCTNYYEVWWFWITWIVIGLICLCCFYHNRRMKNRENQQREENTSVPVISMDQTSNGIQSDTTDTKKLFQLPSYDEIKALPKEPPTYTETISDHQIAKVTDENSNSMAMEPPLLGAPPVYTVQNSEHNVSGQISQHPSFIAMSDTSNDNRLYTMRRSDDGHYTDNDIHENLTASLLENEEEQSHECVSAIS